MITSRLLKTVSFISISVMLGAACTVRQNPTGPMEVEKILVTPKTIALADLEKTIVTVEGPNIRDDVEIYVGGVQVSQSEITSSYTVTEKGESVSFHLPKQMPKNPGKLNVTLVNPESDTGPTNSVTLEGAIELKPLPQIPTFSITPGKVSVFGIGRTIINVEGPKVTNTIKITLLGVGIDTKGIVIPDADLSNSFLANDKGGGRVFFLLPATVPVTASPLDLLITTPSGIELVKKAIEFTP